MRIDYLGERIGTGYRLAEITCKDKEVDFVLNCIHEINKEMLSFYDPNCFVSGDDGCITVEVLDRDEFNKFSSAFRKVCKMLKNGERGKIIENSNKNVKYKLYAYYWHEFKRQYFTSLAKATDYAEFHKEMGAHTVKVIEVIDGKVSFTLTF